MEISRDDRGRPIALLKGNAQKAADEAGVIEIHLSLSFTHTTAVASAVALTQRARPHKEEKHDPRQEIAASFKELRSMLDEEFGATPEEEAPDEQDICDEQSSALDDAQGQQENISQGEQ